MSNSEFKILIIEDDVNLASEWQETLIEQGFHVDHVLDSNQLDSLLTNYYDCFIIDFFHIQGKTFLKDGGLPAIGPIRRFNKGIGKEVLIIATTGYYRNDRVVIKVSAEETAYFIGADHFIKKPFDFINVLSYIENWRKNKETPQTP